MINVSKVKIKKHALARFRRLALNSNLEIMAMMIGKVTDDVAIIEKLVYPKYYASQTPIEVSWWDHEVEAAQKYAKVNHLDIIGDIHSHPGCDAVMSEQDYTYLEEDKLCGICAVYPKTRNTVVRFWTKHKALSIDTEYF